MSLSSALNTAKSSLAATQTQTAIVSRNVANYNTAGATRKYANVVTGPEGRVEVRSVAQSQNSVLFRNMLDSTSTLSGSVAVLDGLQRISETIGDTDGNGSPATLISNLSDALQSFAVSPGNYEFARSAATAAQDLATNLNEATKTADVIRRDADDSLVLAAEDMNKLLADIERLNDKVVAGTKAGQDVTDFVDQRDQAVTQLAGYVGVSAQVRGDNDLVLHTDSGVTLFDKKARLVEYTSTAPLVPGQDGNAFKIDGTVVTGDNAYMPIRDGKVAGLVQLRDETIVTYQSQLDEMARGLISAFQETKNDLAPDAVGADPKDGLFTAADPLVADPMGAGVAGRLRVVTAVKDNPFLIRDGGINDIDADPATPNPYLSNTTSAAGFTGRINALIGAMGQDRDFTAPGADGKGSLLEFAASSMSWLQASRSETLSQADYKQTLLDKTNETLSDETGINLETELTLLLDLQRSFQASSKLISTVDDMLATLLQSV